MIFAKGLGEEGLGGHFSTFLCHFGAFAKYAKIHNRGRGEGGGANGKSANWFFLGGVLHSCFSDLVFLRLLKVFFCHKDVGGIQALTNLNFVLILYDFYCLGMHWI